ncbi:hypothetical protein QJS66_07970 [Kocuria rhizophila]|nr:hypothetical protein QJS66_07970 [Kocuria rhizophila]
MVTASLTLFAAIAIALLRLQRAHRGGYILTALPVERSPCWGRMWARRQLMRRRSRGSTCPAPWWWAASPAPVELVGELQSRPDAGFDPVVVYTRPRRTTSCPSSGVVRLPENALAPSERRLACRGS